MHTDSLHTSICTYVFIRNLPTNVKYENEIGTQLTNTSEKANASAVQGH